MDLDSIFTICFLGLIAIGIIIDLCKEKISDKAAHDLLDNIDLRKEQESIKNIGKISYPDKDNENYHEHDNIVGRHRNPMSYYDQKKSELENLLSTIKYEKVNFEHFVQHEREKLNEEIQLKHEILAEEDAWNKKLKEGVIQMAKERQIGFPWLAEAYDELFALQDAELVRYLQNKPHPAVSAAEIVKEQSRLRRQAQQENKINRYIIQYYENIAPFLIDLKEEVDIDLEQNRDILREYSKDELQDEVTNYLTKQEYRQLSTVERNQLALDRFWKRPKSKWLIGRLYERYIGYLYEEQGYDVDYIGIFKGFEDLGRDLICHKDNDLIVIQCKNWAKFRNIYEKHIFQFFGTVFQYRDENPNKNVKAIFYTSTELSDLARKFAHELKIELKEDFPLDINYPCIKCHTSKGNNHYAPPGTKIYHLPFDQQYDKTKLEKKYGEFYCRTVKEAEDAGFRRAFRYRGYNTK